eukprot:CAMPEP_0196814254 /NCGR_PEP_ID=MMETSP1362-20130617/42178_1 /TAXON_ID=163516 /ORGANISM="Leptocylindrus danicus, Strain CCMP1856" /LENGTH=478 /DNA_ID=CAMNT_0042190807 /DNA_START=237 /DNA_END=1673 /DNA_ORIENTATION=-
MVESYFIKKQEASTTFSWSFGASCTTNACTTSKDLDVHDNSNGGDREKTLTNQTSDEETTKEKKMKSPSKEFCWDNFLSKGFSWMEHGGEDNHEEKITITPSKEFVNTYRRDNLDDFLSWAFFCKHRDQLSDWEVEELHKCYKVMRDDLNFDILPGKSDAIIPLRLNLDEPLILFRPLVFYGFVYFLKALAWSVLLFCGFRRYRSSNGLTYWFRDDCDSAARRAKHHDEVPLVFFHGISPGGVTMYLPFLFNCLGLGGRQAFLFESPGISMEMSMKILSEDDTVSDVREAIDRHAGVETRVQVVGHSFGTFTAAWFNHSFPQRVRQILLFDPVSILVADNMVYQNFVFARGAQEAVTTSSRLATFLMASTEAYMQYYLRRKFFWYNNEIYLDDIDQQAKALVFLSMKDEILDAHRVAQEVDRFTIEQQGKGPVVEKFCWPDSKHGDFVMDRHAWKGIRKAIEAQKMTFVKTYEAKKER